MRQNNSEGPQCENKSSINPSIYDNLREPNTKFAQDRLTDIRIVKSAGRASARHSSGPIGFAWKQLRRSRQLGPFRLRSGSCTRQLGETTEPARRRVCIEHVKSHLDVTEGGACAALGQHRSTQRKVPRGREDAERLIAEVLEAGPAIWPQDCGLAAPGRLVG